MWNVSYENILCTVAWYLGYGCSHAICDLLEFSVLSFHSHVQYQFRNYDQNLKTKLTEIWKGFNTYTEETIEDFLGITHLAHVLDALFGESVHGLALIKDCRDEQCHNVLSQVLVPLFAELVPSVSNLSKLEICTSVYLYKMIFITLDKSETAQMDSCSYDPHHVHTP